MYKIETDRMIIREFTSEDAGDLHEILGDAETMKLCEPAYSYEKTKEFLEDFCIGRKGALAAAQKESGKVIGYILFKSMEEKIYEMGWFFNRKYWRQVRDNAGNRADLHLYGILREDRITGGIANGQH